MVVDILLNSKNNILLLGPGGCGKTYCINKFVELAEECGKIVATTAATGVAAINVNGSTLHRFFGIGLGQGEPEQLISLVKKNKTALKRIKSTQILIIDEISMVGAKLFSKLNSVAKFIRRSEKPFGGMRLIVAGDFLQLPPVKDDWVFKSSVWEEMQFKPLFMTEPKRYNDLKFYETLMRARIGKINEDDLTKFKERQTAYNEYLNKKETLQVKPTILYSLKCDVDLINQAEMEKIAEIGCKYVAADTLVPKEKDVKIDWYKPILDDLAPQTLCFKKGAQVMITRNLDVEAQICNGTRAVITDMNPETITVRLRNGEDLTIDKMPFTYEDNRGIVTRAQFPLILAFALTIHKSQGSTLDFCIVDLGSEVFSPGQAYVALSRVRNWNSLLLSNFYKKSIRADGDALNYIQSLTAADT